VFAEGIADGSVRAVEPSLAVRTLLSDLNAVDMGYRRIDAQSAAKVHDLVARP